MTHYRSELLVAMLLAGIAMTSRGLCAQVFRPEVGVESEWVVRRVIPSEFAAYGQVIRWGDGFTQLGDPNRDGRMDFAVLGRPIGLSLGPFPLLLVAGGSGKVTLRSEGPLASLDLREGFLIQHTPGGYRAVYQTLAGTTGIRALPSQVWVSDVPVPSPPPGKPPYQSFSGFRPFVDSNRDGWDEFLFFAVARQGGASFGVWGLLDGLSLQPQWQTYLPLETVSVPLQSQFAPSHVDLNGDGIEDVLTWAMKGTEHWFHALSGSDGSVIWTFVDSRNFGTWDRYAFPAPDLNQDGIRDLLITQPPFRQPTSGMGPDPGNLYAISGVDGSVIWENRTLGYLDPGYGSSTMYRRLNIQFGLPMGDLDRDGTSDVAVVSEEYNFPVDNRFKILLVDGSDGSFTGIWEDFPGDLAPFFPRDRIGWPTRFRLGDTDGDGYVEMAFGVAAHGYVCSSTGLLGKHLVTIGRRTLFAPREIAAGDGFEYHLDVPRGANCRFHLLLSGAFVADDTGFHVGDWDTSLAVGPALSWSQAHPPFHDVLDGNGYATVPMRLPGKAVLAGRSIYARAWIEEPGRPGEVRTMTSLAITRVRPR